MWTCGYSKKSGEPIGSPLLHRGRRKDADEVRRWVFVVRLDARVHLPVFRLPPLRIARDDRGTNFGRDDELRGGSHFDWLRECV